MFTGLIADIGRVTALESDADGATVEIATALAGDLREGDSVAVEGVCLTATSIADGRFRAQAMSETLRRSTLGALRPGGRVNLELPLAADGRLGGHVVQGHVDATGTVIAVRDDGLSRVLRVSVPHGLLRYLVEKGSVALGGVSLTVSGLDDDAFEVSLIPETLQRTTLGEASVGTELNVEVDVLAKHVERLLRSSAAGNGGTQSGDREEGGGQPVSRLEVPR